jgi:L-alanine-DL-glutamate epimerase-like enolase superfamily enzyme
VKVGSERTTAELGERIGAVRMAVGDGIEIRLDANGAWDTTASIERARAVADLDIAYIEQPIASDRPEDLAAVRAASPVAVAADEAVSSTDAARALIDARAVDVIVLKLARVGGPTAALSVASAARAAGIRITVSSLLETGVGLAAAARVAGRLSDAAHHAHGLATASALESDLLATPMAIDQGRLALPDEPLGLDEEALARWSVERIGDQR